MHGEQQSLMKNYIQIPKNLNEVKISEYFNLHLCVFITHFIVTNYNSEA